MFDALEQPDAALEPELWPQTPSGADAWQHIAPSQGPKTPRLKPFLRLRRGRQRHRGTTFALAAATGRFWRRFSEHLGAQNGGQASIGGRKRGPGHCCPRTMGVLREVSENVQKNIGKPMVFVHFRKPQRGQIETMWSSSRSTMHLTASRGA